MNVINVMARVKDIVLGMKLVMHVINVMAMVMDIVIGLKL